MCQKMISTDEALKRALWHIKVPSMTVLFVPLIIYVTFAKLNYVPPIGYEGLKWFAPVFIISIGGSWLIWSIQVPRWRLWSYQRVNDIAHLKEEAEYSQIIWPEGSFFQKTELASKKVWDEINRLESANNKNT